MSDGKKAGGWIMAAALAFCFSLGWGFGLESAGKQAEHEGHAIYGKVLEAFHAEHPEHRKLYPWDERATHEANMARLNAGSEQIGRFARERFPAEMERRDELYRKSNVHCAWADRLKILAAVIAAAGLLALVVFAVKTAAERAQTRGQRAGVALAALSFLAPVCHAAKHGVGDFIDFFVGSEEFTAFVVLAGAGILLLLRLPQRLVGWIAGGRKD